MFRPSCSAKPLVTGEGRARSSNFPVVVGKILQCYYHEWHCYLAASGVDCVWPNRGIPMLYAARLRLAIGTLAYLHRESQ
jgi:hypothetical protein